MAQEIVPGRIVRIHSLQSPTGLELNDQRAAILRPVPNEDRFEVVLEFNAFDGTKAIRPENLTLERRLGLPSNGNRGIVRVPDDDMCQTLCELLLWHRDGYTPPDGMLVGIAGMSFMRLGQSNFEYLHPVQMEQVGAVHAMANICEQAEDEGTLDVMFAILEGDTMYMEAFLQTLYWTGYIGPEEGNDQPNSFYNTAPTSLTPDQDKAAYIRFMKEGPLQLLTYMSRYNFGQAFYAAVRSCQFYHLFVQRLLRLAAREALGTMDGRALGIAARNILKYAVVGMNPIAPLSAATANHVLAQAAQVLTAPDTVSVANVGALLHIAP